MRLSSTLIGRVTYGKLEISPVITPYDVRAYFFYSIRQPSKFGCSTGTPLITHGALIMVVASDETTGNNERKDDDDMTLDERMAWLRERVRIVFEFEIV
jgi:hypothetical protein